MSWFSRRRAEHDAYLEALRAIADAQARTAEMVMKAVTEITATQAKQVEAINTHLSLFKMTEPPSVTSNTGAAENRAWAEQNGFPFDGSAEEIAKWIEANDIVDE